MGIGEPQVSCLYSDLVALLDDLAGLFIFGQSGKLAGWKHQLPLRREALPVLAIGNGHHGTGLSKLVEDFIADAPIHLPKSLYFRSVLPSDIGEPADSADTE